MMSLRTIAVRKMPVHLFTRQSSSGVSGPFKQSRPSGSSRRTLLWIGGSAFVATLTVPSLVQHLPSSITRHFSSIAPSIPISDDDLQHPSPIVRLISSKVLDDLRVSHSVAGPNPLAGRRLVLLQYQSCPFCCKVRAFLEFHGIPYDVIEVNPVMRGQLRFTSYRKVPIVLVQNQNAPNDHLLQLNDSSTIISILGTFLARQSGASNRVATSNNLHKNDELLDIARSYRELVFDGKSKNATEVVNRYFLMLGDLLSTDQYRQIENELLEERKWRKWADDVLGKVLLSPFC